MILTESAKLGWLHGYLGDLGHIIACVAWVVWVYKILALVNKVLTWIGVNCRGCKPWCWSKISRGQNQNF